MRVVPDQLAERLYPAAELIAERGLEGTKIEEIAKVSGVPKATLYYYFAGKEEVLTYLLNHLLATVAERVTSAVGASGPARERLVATVTVMLDTMLERPAVCRALMGDLGRATRLPALTAAFDTTFYQPIERLLHDGAADGSLRPTGEPAVAAMTVFAAITVAGLTYSVDPPGKPAAELVRPIADVLLQGLGGAAEPATSVKPRRRAAR